MSKKISITGVKARELAIKGADYVADVVKSTLGPFGLNAMIEKGNEITNDGYKISSQLCDTIENEFERRGALVCHEASSRTNDQVGDATSTAWALAQAVIKEAVRHLSTDKSLTQKKSPAEVKRMIFNSKNEVIEMLKSNATPIKNEAELIKSALVSVENKEIAEMLGSMQWELGEDGIIIAEEVNDLKCSIEKVNGIRLDNGFGTKIVVTNPEKQSLEIVKCATVLTNYTIGEPELANMKENIFKPLVSRKQLSVAIIARAFTSDAIKMCVESGQNGFQIYPINAPYVDQNEVMHDLEAVLGGRYIDTEESKLEDIFITDIGFAESLQARQFDAIVAGTKDEKSEKRIATRVELLKAKLKGEQSEFYKKMLQSRISQLTNGFALLKVGAESVVERGRLKDKCDDACYAVRWALKGGTVKGAGLAFKEISEQLPDTNILKRPLLCINDQIMSSAPVDWEVEDWVRDPFLVLKSALENACDVAGTFATTNTVITSKNPHECKCNENTTKETE